MKKVMVGATLYVEQMVELSDEMIDKIENESTLNPDIDFMLRVALLDVTIPFSEIEVNDICCIVKDGELIHEG